MTETQMRQFCPVDKNNGKCSKRSNIWAGTGIHNCSQRERWHGDECTMPASIKRMFMVISNMQLCRWLIHLVDHDSLRNASLAKQKSVTRSEDVKSADWMGVCPWVKLITKSKKSPPKPEEEPRVDVRTQLDTCTWTISHPNNGDYRGRKGVWQMTKVCSSHNIVIPSL